MFSSLRRIPSKYPFWFGVGYSAFKGGAVDALIQTQAEGVPLTELDLRRNGLFTLFNASFAGAWQYFLFVNIMGKMFPGAGSFAAKSVVDKLKGSSLLHSAMIMSVCVHSGSLLDRSCKLQVWNEFKFTIHKFSLMFHDLGQINGSYTCVYMTSARSTTTK
jgi:hypothetical protein